MPRGRKKKVETVEDVQEQVENSPVEASKPSIPDGRAWGRLPGDLVLKKAKIEEKKPDTWLPVKPKSGEVTAEYVTNGFIHSYTFRWGNQPYGAYVYTVEDADMTKELRISASDIYAKLTK